MKMCHLCESAPATAWFYVLCCGMDTLTRTAPLCDECAKQTAAYHDIERRAKVSSR